MMILMMVQDKQPLPPMLDELQQQVLGGAGEGGGGVHHVLAPGSPAHGPGRHCLLWACKACKKKTVTVDRRKVRIVGYLSFAII